MRFPVFALLAGHNIFEKCEKIFVVLRALLKIPETSFPDIEVELSVKFVYNEKHGV